MVGVILLYMLVSMSLTLLDKWLITGEDAGHCRTLFMRGLLSGTAGPLIFAECLFSAAVSQYFIQHPPQQSNSWLSWEHSNFK